VPHVVFKNLALLEPLGSREMRPAFPLEIPSSAVADATNARFGGVPYAVINPGAAWPNKRWPADRFGALAAAIRDRFGLRSLVLWGPGEESLAEDVTRTSIGLPRRRRRHPSPTCSLSRGARGS
jgi:heptosyltransferase-1